MRFLLLIVFITSSYVIFSQEDYEAEFQKKYESNIKKEYINDVYIPSDFQDAFAELNRLANEEALQKFKSADEDVIRRRLHFGIGRWISLNWNFEEGSRFSHQMKLMGVTFPDDMIEMTIVSFHRHLNGIPLDLEGQSKLFVEKRKQENEERKKKAEILDSKQG